MDNDINNKIQGFLQYVFEMVEDMERLSKEEGASSVCPNCGTTYAGFKKTGKIGCAQCYSVFRTQLTKALVNIHGSSNHKGSVPQGMNGRHSGVVIRRELAENRLLLKQAVDNEEYEDAARLRDLILQLEQEGGDGHGDEMV
ncbi:MAG: UvrB/UvrC motif-containing protein [Defluviitaleaceae bacterium]|nr:UvrB/UvrC motif-containing protein [Defluviitaleaceae bacterium]